jgi:hypothetical protein
MLFGIMSQYHDDGLILTPIGYELVVFIGRWVIREYDTAKCREVILSEAARLTHLRNLFENPLGSVGDSDELELAIKRRVQSEFNRLSNADINAATQDIARRYRMPLTLINDSDDWISVIFGRAGVSSSDLAEATNSSDPHDTIHKTLTWAALRGSEERDWHAVLKI